MHTIEDIISFIEKETYSKNVKPDDDLFKQHGIWGGDLEDLLISYSKKYRVDMDGFHFFHHSQPESGTFPFVPVNKPPTGMTFIPITPELLLKSANKGKWLVEYPPDRYEKYRTGKNYNYVNYILLIILIALIAFIWLYARN